MDLESAARMRANESQMRRILSDIHSKIHGRAIASSTVADYAKQWLGFKLREVKKSTHDAYTRTLADFLEFLGDHKNSDLGSITPIQVKGAREVWGEKHAPKTANNRLKCLRAFFQSAWRDGLIEQNPAAKVDVLATVKAERLPFDLLQLKILLAAAADTEWRGMILLGYYTGQRLGDLASLRWSSLDLDNRRLSISSKKRDRRTIIPLATPLHRYLEERRRSKHGPQVFPKLAEKFSKGGASPLSQEFYDLLVSAKLAEPRLRKDKSTGRGRRAKRVKNKRTFHSLRRSTTSSLKNAGVSEAVVMDIVGHDSAEVSQDYTVIEDSVKLTAVNKLPDITSD